MRKLGTWHLMVNGIPPLDLDDEERYTTEINHVVDTAFMFIREKLPYCEIEVEQF